MTITISLTNDEVEYVSKELHGSGGFQSFLSRIQARLHGNQLELNTADIEKIARYVRKYGRGGFQDRLKRILDEIESLSK